MSDLSANAVNQNVVFNGLGTFTFGAPVAGVYFVEGHLSLPTLVSGAGASACVVTVNKNGSPVYTGAAGASGFYTNVTLAVADTLAIVLSSSAAPDLVMNSIKSCFSIGLGE